MRRFAIKSSCRTGAHRFIDRFGDFEALLDDEGVRLSLAVFAKRGEDLGPAERAVLDALLEGGVLPDPEAARKIDPPDLLAACPLEKVEFEITRRCNLACRHCLANRGALDIDPGLIEAAVDDLEALGVAEVILNGGETLLHPAFDRILGALAGRFKIILFTNGLLLDGPRIERLVAARVARLNVSLDGFRGAHEALRGRGTFDPTVANLRAALAAGLAVQVAAVVHPGNAATLPEFVAWCRDDLKAGGIKISTIYRLGEAARHPELLETPEIAAAVYGAHVGRAGSRRLGDGLMPCAAGVTQCFVNAAGAVFPCRLFEDDRFLMGRLPDRSLATLHASFLSARSDFTVFDDGRLAACRGCAAIAACGTGCRARAWLETGDLYAPDAFCCGHHLPGGRLSGARG